MRDQINPMGGSHTDGADQVDFLEREFAAIASIGLPIAESRDVLNEYLEGLHKRPPRTDAP